MKRFVRKMISKIVDRFYSDHFFYNRGLFDDVDTQKAAISLAFVLSKKVPKVGDECEIAMTGVTNKGNSVGDFLILIKRIGEDEK